MLVAARTAAYRSSTRRPAPDLRARDAATRMRAPAVLVRRLFGAVLATVIVAGTATADAFAELRDPETAASPYVVTLADPRDDARAVTSRLQRSVGFVASATYTTALRGFAANLTRPQVSQLSDKASVASVIPDREIAAAGSKSSTRVRPEITPSGVTRIGAADNGAADSAVAVLDTGIDLANPDLNAAPGVNCVKAGKSPQDDDGHGTHVAGIIAARSDGADTVGVAPNTRLYAVKVLDSSGKGRLSGLLCGIDWVQANAARLNIGVANVSIGARGSDDGACGTRVADPLHMAICASTAAGTLYVAAAGNSGSGFAATAPAAYPEVLAVTGMTDTDGLPGGHGGPACEPSERDDTAGSYSNYATTSAAAAHTLAAPGTCVTSTGVGGGVTTMLGTSMAAPHVTGTAALCLGTGGTEGACRGLGSAAAVIERLRGDAERRAQKGYGFAGDPFQPLAGRHMGHLVSAADY
jgi:subtilisin family serine protease